MVISNSANLSARINDLKSYDEKRNYEPRFNYKMTDIQAAIGLVQINRLDGFIRRRRQIAARYRRELTLPGIKVPPDDPEHIYYRFALGLEADSQKAIRELNEKGIGCNRPVYTPLHRCLGIAGYPITDHAWQTSLSIPIYPLLTDEDAVRIIKTMNETITSLRA
jgi:perosamine synthetase